MLTEEEITASRELAIKVAADKIGVSEQYVRNVLDRDQNLDFAVAVVNNNRSLPDKGVFVTSMKSALEVT